MRTEIQLLLPTSKLVSLTLSLMKMLKMTIHQDV